MLQRKGLLCVVKALAIMMLLALAMPTPVSAQSDMAARVKIHTVAGNETFGDVLLVRDTVNSGDTIVLYGLTGGTPAQCEVSITPRDENGDSTQSSITCNSSFVGKFPILKANPIRIDMSANPVYADIECVRGGSTIGSGTFTLDITGEEIRNALLSGEMPPHRLIEITPSSGYEFASDFVGKILLTQRVRGRAISSPTQQIILDEFEGISNSILPGSGLSEVIQSVTPFSQLGIYGVPISPESPNRDFRIATLTTETYYDNEFKSNGAFMPFSISNVNSINQESINSDILSSAGLAPSPTDFVFLRVQALRDPDPDTGAAPLRFLAQFPNDVTAGFSVVNDPVNNNPDNNNDLDPNAPKDQGIAVISGMADPYSLVTAHVDDSTSSEVLVSGRTDASGNFTMTVPSARADSQFSVDNLYISRQEVYLAVSDPFGNFSAYFEDDPLERLVIDESSNFITINDPIPPATPSPSSTYVLSGTAEPVSILLATGITTEGIQFRAGKGIADANGNFVFSASSAFQYIITAVDQAGNEQESGLIEAKDDTQVPVVTSIDPEFPFIRISGTAEPGANIRVFGFQAGEIPDTDDVVASLPAEAVFLGEAESGSTTQADEDGNFTLVIPSLVSRVVYIQAVDFLGNESDYRRVELVDDDGEPLTNQLVKIEDLTVQNNPPNIVDVVTGQLVDVNSNTPVTNPDGSLFVTAYSGLLTDLSTAIPADQVADGSLLDVTFPFVDEIAETMEEVNADGSFELGVLDRSRLTNTFVNSFFVVVLELVVDMNTGRTFVRPVGFEPVTSADGLDRIGPTIGLAPASTDIELNESGEGTADFMNIRRIYPAEMNAGSASLPDDASPFVVVFADNTIYNTDAYRGSVITDVRLEGGTNIEYTLRTGSLINQVTVPLDVNSRNIRTLDRKPLNALSGRPFGFDLLPIPGVTGLNLGDNHWNRSNQSISGYPIVFVALIDGNGNLSPNPIPVFLDVKIKNPDITKIQATQNSIVGAIGAVEKYSNVSLYENADRSGWIATTEANELGGFIFSDLTFTESEIYIVSSDRSGNESNAVKIDVTKRLTQFVILDEFSLLHTPNTAISINSDSSSSARALAGIENTASPAITVLAATSPYYVLTADGNINKVGDLGSKPKPTEQFTISGQFARDMEVINSDPFQGYVLLGNGLVVPFGDAPFYGDIVTLQRMDENIPERTRIVGVEPLFSFESGIVINEFFTGENLLFDDINGNGRLETEDTNQNGILDPPFVLPGGGTRSEDANGNGRLDSEVVDLNNLGQGFFTDIARDLELVRDADGDLLGYVILDGNGILWPFFQDETEEQRQSDFIDALMLPTNGFSPDDIFKGFELIIDEEGLIQDYITMDAFGRVFATPGGLLGAGESDDPDNRGNLSGVMDAPIFDFNIARDIRMNMIDSNQDGHVDWQDGFYILDGYGTIHAIGNAPVIPDTPFFGLDIAVDLEFGAQPLE